MFRKKYFILILAGIAVLAGFFIWQDIQKQKLPTLPTLPTPGVGNELGEENATSTPEEKSASQAKEETDYFKSRMPSLDREIIITENLSEESKNKLTAEIKFLSHTLKQEYNYYQGWLQLGLLRKALGDYEGTKQAWEFAALIRPKEFLAFNNLGVLFWQYLKDYPKAEKNFLQSIENDPSQLMVYQNLHELYRFSYKEKADLADDILLQASQANPKNSGPLILLSRYYNEIGDKEKARTYLEQALTLEPSNKAIQEELNRL